MKQPVKQLYSKPTRQKQAPRPGKANSTSVLPESRTQRLLAEVLSATPGDAFEMISSGRGSAYSYLSVAGIGLDSDGICVVTLDSSGFPDQVLIRWTDERWESTLRRATHSTSSVCIAAVDEISPELQRLWLKWRGRFIRWASKEGISVFALKANRPHFEFLPSSFANAVTAARAVYSRKLYLTAIRHVELEQIFTGSLWAQLQCSTGTQKAEPE